MRAVVSIITCTTTRYVIFKNSVLYSREYSIYCNASTMVSNVL